MSKSSRKTGHTAHQGEGSRTDREKDVRVEETLVDLAEDLGKLLGTAQRRMTTWLGERQEIATQLVQIRDTANAYLRELTAGGATLAAAIERGRRSSKGSSNPEGATAAGTGQKTRPTPPRKTTSRKT